MSVLCGPAQAGRRWSSREGTLPRKRRQEGAVGGANTSGVFLHRAADDAKVAESL